MSILLAGQQHWLADLVLDDDVLVGLVVVAAVPPEPDLLAALLHHVLGTTLTLSSLLNRSASN